MTFDGGLTMTEHHRNFVFDQEDKYRAMADEEPRAVFVDTNLDTHFAVPISPLSTVYSLKEQIAYEHFRCFPEHGNITVNLILVKLEESYYHLPDSMLLKTAFYGLPKTWFVSADVFTSTGHHMKPPSQHYYEFKHVQPSSQHHYEFEHADPSSQHHCVFNHVRPSSQPHATLNLSCNPKKNRKKKRTHKGEIGADESVPLKDLPQFEKTITGKVSCTKHLNEPHKGHHDTSTVQPSAVLSEVGVKNIVNDSGEEAELVHKLEGTGTNLAENLDKQSEIDYLGLAPGPQAKSSKKRKKIDKTAGDVSPSHLNNVPELLVSQESLNVVETQKQIEEDVTPLKSEKTAKRRKKNKAKNSDAETQNLSSKRQNNDKIADDSRHIGGDRLLEDDFSRPEESVETMTGKLKMSKNLKVLPEKDPPGSPEEKPDEITREMPAPITVIQSGQPKKRIHKKHSAPAPDLSSLPVNQHLDETAMEMDASIKAAQTDDLLTNRDTDDDPSKSENTAKERKTNGNEREHMNNVPKHVSQPESPNLVERERNTEEDIAPSKAENTAKKKKKAKSSASLNMDSSNKRQNDDQNADDSVNKDLSNTRQNNHQNADDSVSKDLSNKRLNDDKKDDETRHISGERLVEADISRPEDSVETLSGKLEKRSRKQKDVPRKDPPGPILKVQPDEEAREMAASISVIQNDKPKKKSKKKQPDPSTLLLNQHSDETKSEMNAPKRADDLLTKSNINDAQNRNEVRQGEERHGDFSQAPRLEASADLAEVRRLNKDIHQGQKAVKPSKKLEENDASVRRSSHLVSASAQKKGLLASAGAIFDDGNSSSSNEDRTDASSSSATVLPGNLSSSDYSEGESEGLVKSQLDSSKGDRRAKGNSSGMKLESILRSSSRYKKAKLVASQSQGESEPVEFVPDSQADM